MSYFRLLLPAALLSASAFAAPAELTMSNDALANGQFRKVVTELSTGSAAEMSDPARLINLGTAHARLGNYDAASDAFRRAMYSDVRYDLELADGSVIDSREAARIALAKLNKDYHKQTASR